MLTLQFGQCGNQVGEELFSAICTDIDSPRVGITRESNRQYIEDALERWFGSAEGMNGRPRRARAVLVDTEEKVVRKVDDFSGRRWTYRACNALCVKDMAGSGNNWARGYTMNGDQLDELLTNAVVGEFEGVDRLQGFLLLLSSAGGTGSGLGSKALQVLRDEYPTKLFAAAILLPHTCGEVAVQHYNTALTLPRFNHLADVVFLFENGQIIHPQACLGNKKTGFAQLNTAISENLIGLLQPVREVTSVSLNSLLSAISPHPSYKFATVESAFAECDFLRSTGVNRTSANNRAVSDVLIARGNGKGAQPRALRGQPPQHCLARWANQSEGYTRFCEIRGIKGHTEFLTLSRNNSRIHHPLDASLQAAWTSYAHGAFLHKYKEFGLEEDDFLQAFATMEDIVQNYGQLQRGK